MVAGIIPTMSHRRFDTYLVAAGHDQTRALDLYLWNAKIGAAFHLPIQAVEVSLRNRVNHALMAEFGPDWWQEHRFEQLIDHERKRDLATVKVRIHRKQIVLETDQIVAGLSFGFWVGMLHGRYNPRIWGAQLRTSFPHLPHNISRDNLFHSAINIANFRNRISHHEPLVGTNITQKYSDIMKLLKWLCPDTSAWAKAHCEVSKIVRQKP